MAASGPLRTTKSWMSSSAVGQGEEQPDSPPRADLGRLKLKRIQHLPTQDPFFALLELESGETTGRLQRLVPVTQDTGDTAMADDRTVSSRTTFAAGTAAEPIIERVLQQQDISRSYTPIMKQNTVGCRPCMGDAPQQEVVREHSAFCGRLAPSADVAVRLFSAVRHALGDPSATKSAGVDQLQGRHYLGCNRDQ